MKKKIHIIANFAPTIQYQRQELIKYFLRKKFSLNLVCSEANKLAETFKNPNIQFENISLNRTSLSMCSQISTLVNLYKYLLKTPNDEIVHCFTIKPILFINLLNVLFFRGKKKTISTFTGLGYLYTHPKSSNFLRRAVNFFLKLSLFPISKYVIFQNSDDKNYFLKLGIIDHNASVILGSGVDTDYFKANQNTLEQDHIKFLFIGRLIKDKGVYELCEAFSELQAYLNKNISNSSPAIKVCLSLAGNFDPLYPNSISKDKFESLLNSDNIHYLGFLKDIKTAIEQHDCVVLPSYREGLPQSLIQAASMGKPLITTNTPGCKDLIHEKKNGFLAEPRSSTSLKKAFIDFTKLSPSQRLQMGQESRILTKSKFCTNVIHNQVEQLYQQRLSS